MDFLGRHLLCMKKNDKEKLYGKKATRGFQGQFRSFGFALNGIATCFLQERNFRFHSLTVGYVFFFGWVLHFTKMEYIIVAAVCGLVVVCEMFNTAIEMVCDLTEPNFNPEAGKLKDIAAGAVMISAFIAFIVGVFLFFSQENLLLLKAFFLDKPLNIVWFLLSVVLFLWIVDGKWIEKIFGDKYKGEI